jgi:hypothetical protein
MNKIISPSTLEQCCRRSIAAGSKQGALPLRKALAVPITHGNDWFSVNDVCRPLGTTKNGNTSIARVLGQRLSQTGIAEATRLQTNAIATQLLAVDYRHATYRYSEVARVDTNLWRIEHRLTLDDEWVRAIEMRPGLTEPDFVTMEEGAPVLIKRIDRDVVEMLRCQLNPGTTASRRL